METPRSSMAPARTGSYHTAHAGLLLHVRQQIENGSHNSASTLPPTSGDVSGPGVGGSADIRVKNDSQLGFHPLHQ